MKVFGLTGGVASGKSTAAAWFRQQHVPVIDADALSKEATWPGTPGLAGIVEAFGTGILLPSGELDRLKLADEVFSSPAKLQTLNSIIHPQVQEQYQIELDKLSKEGHAWVCYDVPLLFETNLHARISPVVLIATSPEIQIQRAQERSGWTLEQTQRRIRSQMPLADKIWLADYVVYNDGNLDKLYEQLFRVLSRLRQIV